jgi:ubiquitin-protein ligase
MRVKISISQPSAQVVNVPCEATTTVDALVVLLRKRVPTLPADISLFFDGGKLFGEDTLNDLGIKEGDIITDSLGGASDFVSSSASSTPAGSAPTPSNTGDSGNAGAPAPPPSSSSSSSVPSQPTDVRTVLKPPPRTLAEILMVCFDISSSMKASFVTDLDPGLGSSVVTRVAAAKICFGAFIDKTLAFEYPHAVGLIIFGETVREKIPISNNLDSFEQVFGELNDSEGSTRLYPAVQLSVAKIIEYKDELQKTGVDLTHLKYRIIAFTDGEDNSGMHAYDVAKTVLENNIVVDAVIIGGSDSAHLPLRSLAHSTGGYTIRIPEDRFSLSAVFERESVLALSERKNVKPDILPTISLPDFLSFGDLEKYPVVTVSGLVSGATVAASATTTNVSTPISKAVSISNSNSAPISASSAPAGLGAGAAKRISAELRDIQKQPSDFFEVFVTENNISDWKVLIKGPAGTPYEGGAWILHFIFPSDYPFKPPKLQILTPIYHCNVSSEGRVCLNILRDSWSPALTFGKLMQNIKLMLIEPDINDVLDAWKGSLARTEPEVYKKNVREFTLKNASGDIDALKKQHNIN